MAATVGRIVLLVTGGYAGSALYTYRDNLPQFFGSTLRDLGNLVKMQNNGNSNIGLEKQVEMLSQDMRALMVSGRNAGTIVLSSSQGSAFSKVLPIFYSFCCFLTSACSVDSYHHPGSWISLVQGVSLLRSSVGIKKQFSASYFRDVDSTNKA